MTEEELKEVKERVRRYMKRRYNVDLDDLEITSTPGYWQDRRPQKHSGHPLHGYLFCEGPFRATYTYFDSARDANGRYADRYRTWRLLYECEKKWQGEGGVR